MKTKIHTHLAKWLAEFKDGGAELNAGHMLGLWGEISSLPGGALLSEGAAERPGLTDTKADCCERTIRLGLRLQVPRL